MTATPAGWYDDPEQPGARRWWDGERWTEHRHEAAASEVLVYVRTGKDERSDVVATADRITMQGQTVALAEIDGVEWSAVRSHLNGAYMGTIFNLQVRAGDRKLGAGMSTGSKDHRLDEFQDAYGRLVALLDSTVCRRLADGMAARLGAGETVTLGPAGARVELTSEGFRLKKPFSKVVPWSAVAGTESEGGRLYFLVHKKPSEQPKRHSIVPLDGENIVVLPHLVDRLTGRG